MVQEFHIVRCFSCETFQVDQVKKSTNKWTCKVCNVKQSIKKVYFGGTAKDCRINCQTLNKQRYEVNTKETNHDFIDENDDVITFQDCNNIHVARDSNPLSTDHIPVDNSTNSKWQTYLSDSEAAEGEDCEDQTDTPVVFRDSSAKYSNMRREANRAKRKPYERKRIEKINAPTPDHTKNINRTISSSSKDDNDVYDNSLENINSPVAKTTNVSKTNQSKLFSKWDKFFDESFSAD